MKSQNSNRDWVEWFSASERHQHFKEWSSELLFIKDEHLFFEDLISSYSTLMINPKLFPESQEIVDAITKSQKQNENLIKSINEHENQLQIMLDGIDELDKEEVYASKHVELISQIKEFQKEFKTLKKHLFKFITSIIKEEKQKRLLDGK